MCRRQYHDIKDEWFGNSDVFDRPDVLEASSFPRATVTVLSADPAGQERHRIDVDCRRTDRSQPLFASTPGTPAASGDADADEKARHRRF